MKTLKTNTSNWTKVFRKIVLQLENDADFRRVVGKDRLRSWAGVPGDKSPMIPATGAPVVRLTPMPGGVGWWSEDAQAGTLRVKVELVIASLCVDDAIDLYDLIVQALRPSNGQFAQALVALGAETGEIVFVEPAIDAQPEAQPEGILLGTGGFQLTVLRVVNP